MKGKIRGAISARFRPIGLSLLAAALTAIAFAAVSVAKDDGEDGGEGGGDRFEMRVPPPGVAPMLEGLSGQERDQLEAFRRCMQDEGAPAPPRFRPGDGPPQPPSDEEIERIREAHEACEGELPEQLRERGFPRFGHGPCGPSPGLDQEDEGREDDGEEREDRDEPGDSDE